MHAERNHCAFLQNADEVFITVPPHSYKPSTFPLHKDHNGIIINKPKTVDMSTVYTGLHTEGGGGALGFPPSSLSFPPQN